MGITGCEVMKEVGRDPGNGSFHPEFAEGVWRISDAVPITIAETHRSLVLQFLQMKLPSLPVSRCVSRKPAHHDLVIEEGHLTLN